MKANNLNINIEKQRYIRIISRRTLFIKVFTLFVFLVIVARLVQLQIIRAKDLQQVAIAQYTRSSVLPALRGRIYDANGYILASSTVALKVGVSPKFVSSAKAESISGYLSQITGRPKSFYLQKFDTTKKYVCLEKDINAQHKMGLYKFNTFGIIIEEVQKRLYPYGKIAGPILGGMISENEGKDGIEKFFNSELRGIDGSIINYRDGRKKIQRVIDFPRIEPKNGHNIYLTIDLSYQSIAEEELKKGVEKFFAESGIVIIMEPKTGEILALAQYPEFDPSSNEPSNLQNRIVKAVTDAVEPGSLFKIVTAAAALEHDKVKPEQVFFAENGKYNCPIGKKKFLPITDAHPYDYLTFEQALEVSSNIVFAKISYAVGGEFVYKMARNFGFGTKTGIELPGETSGKLFHPNQWSGSTLQAMSRGYEVQASPIQIITAFAAIANNGVLVRPFIIKKIEDQASNTVFENQPIIIRRVLSENNARKLSNMLINVVEGKRGTAKLAHIEGLKIAGKTGTARLLVNRKYSTENLLASFVGFFPADNPKIVCLVMLRNPKVGKTVAGMGGTTSAVVFKEIVNRIQTNTNLYEKTQDVKYVFNSDSSELIKLIDVRNMSRITASNLLEKYTVNVNIIGSGDIVMEQVPIPGSLVKKGSEVRLLCYINPEKLDTDFVEVPNVIGLPLKMAISVLLSAGLQVTANGSGVVISQSPDPGIKAALNTVISLICNEKKIAEAYQ